MSGGLLLIVAGTLVIAQVTAGQALQRLGFIQPFGAAAPAAPPAAPAAPGAGLGRGTAGPLLPAKPAAASSGAGIKGRAHP